MGLGFAAIFIFYAAMQRSLGSNRIIRWAATWSVVMTAGFAISSPWLYFGALAIIFFVSASVERTPLVPFLLMLPMVPTGTVTIPGFAGISMLFEIDAILLLAILTMFVLIFSVPKLRRIARGGSATDLFLFAWLVLVVALSLRAPTFTHMLRTAILGVIEVAPVYYAFSRLVKSPRDLQIVSAAFVFSILALSIAAMAESILSWHFFSFVVGSNLFDGALGYKFREGALRAVAVTDNAIVWGYLAAIGGSVAFAVFGAARSGLFKIGAFGAITGGLIASFSRGPWLQFTFSFLAFVASGRNIARKFGLLFGVSGATLIFLLLTPIGERVLSLLPFVGDSSSDTFDYRRQLFDVSLEVIRQNPLLGVSAPRQHPLMQSLIQGEGLIDIVNTYVSVALHKGLVGLTIFVCIFLSALIGVYNQIKRARRFSKNLEVFARGYFGALVGSMFVIATTSSVGQISTYNWVLVGLCVAIVRVVRLQYNEARRAAAQAAPEPA